MTSLSGYVYICHETADNAFVQKLIKGLETGFPGIVCKLAPDDPDPFVMLDELSTRIHDCACFVFIASNASLSQLSSAKEEYRLAFEFHKPVVVIRIGTENLTGRLGRRTNLLADTGMAHRPEAVRQVILHTETPEGQLQTKRAYFDDALAAQRIAKGGHAERLKDEVIELSQQVAAMSEALAHPQAVRERRLEQLSIALELERKPPALLPILANGRRRIVGTYPVLVPAYFEDRLFETKTISDFLSASAPRILLVSGRGGIGKSVMVCRVLQGAERGVLPDDNGAFLPNSLILLSFSDKTARRPSASNLYAALTELWPETAQDILATIDANTSNEVHISKILDAFSNRHLDQPVVVFLDNMEDGIDADGQALVDAELQAVLFSIADASDSMIKVVITSRIRIDAFSSLNPAAFMDVPLDDGLPSPYAEKVFRALDQTGSYGLRNAPESLLTRLRTYTRGFPRAIEAVYMQLSNRPEVSPEDILGRKLPDDRVIDALVGGALRGLDDIDQLVIGTLSVFARPVPANAIDFVLLRWFSHIDASVSLRRLVRRKFVRQQGRLYSLHPVDAALALHILESRSWPVADEATSAYNVVDSKSVGNPVVPQKDWTLPVENLSDDDDDDDGYDFPPKTTPISLASIKRAAADYFQSIRRDRADWKTVDDVEPYLAEFKLRLEMDNTDTPAVILTELSRFLEQKGEFVLLLSLAQKLDDIAEDGFAKPVAVAALVKSYWRLGRTEKAIAEQNRLIAMKEDAGKDVTVERTNLAIFEFEKGKFSEALKVFSTYRREHVLTYYPNPDLPTVLHWISQCHEGMGRLNEALELQQQAYDAAVALCDNDILEAQTHNLASAYQCLNQHAEAKRLVVEALALADKTGNPLWKANHLSLLSSLLYDEGDIAGAKRENGENISLRKKIGDMDGLAWALQKEARWALLAGAADTAKTLATNALEQVPNGSANVRGKSWTALAESYADLNEWQEAERLLRSVLDTLGERESFRLQALLGCCLLNQGRYEGAKKAFTCAITEAREWIGRCTQNVDAHANLGFGLTGLAILGANTRQDAIASYRQASRFTDCYGPVRRRMKDLERLGRACPPGSLNDILEAVDGRSRDAPKPALIPAPVPGPDPAPLSPSPRKLSDNSRPEHLNREKLVELLATKAHDLGSQRYFKDLVERSRLPVKLQRIRTGAITGQPEIDARTLINALLNHGSNPDDGNPALGTLLLTLLTSDSIGIEDASFLVSLIVGYGLIKSTQDIAELSSRFQVPQFTNRPLASGPIPGPNFNIAAHADDVAMQNWLLRPPEFLDVATLLKAVERARSVCRIELPDSSGTGVLIGEDLILTNYHVLARQGTAPAANTANAIVRFGAFSNNGFDATDGQKIGLHDTAAVVAFSPTHEHDFLLLRTALAATRLTDVIPLKVTETNVVARSDLHILQHPDGGVMKLALSTNGVMAIDPANGLIQYITRAAGGSSGSPCFNTNWEMVALHHAEKAQAFGAVREGIMLNSILEKISPHLNGG